MYICMYVDSKLTYLLLLLLQQSHTYIRINIGATAATEAAAEPALPSFTTITVIHAFDTAYIYSPQHQEQHPALETSQVDDTIL